MGLVSRASPVHAAMRNCTGDEGGPFGFGNQVLISSHRKLLRSKAVVVNVVETPGQDSGRHGRERRAKANRCRSLARQASIIDGDTLEIHGTRIRLWGIDAPESSQLCRGDDSLQYRCGAKAVALRR